MRRIVTLTLALLLVLCAAGLVSAQGKITIAYTGYPGGQTPFWAQMTQYVK